MVSRRSLFSQNDRPTDVVIVGAGFAGLAAALGAVERQGRVVVLDRATDLFETPQEEGSLYLNAVAPERQAEQGIVDSPEFFYRQTLAHGKWRADPALVKQLCYKAYIVLKWLERIGIVFEPKVRHIPGGLFARTCVAPHPKACRMTMLQAAVKAGVDVIQGVEFVGLLTEKPRKVTGIRVRDMHGEIHELSAGAVILATGGFASNDELCARHDPRIRTLPESRAGSAMGIGLQEAVKAGGYLVGMDYIELTLGAMAAEGQFTVLPFHPLRYLLADEKGARCVNEENPDDVREAILARDDHQLHLVTALSETDRIPSEPRESILRMVKSGRAQIVRRDEVPRAFSGASPEAWQQTLLRYNSVKTDPFGKSWRAPLTDDSLLVLPVTLIRTATLGGVHIDEFGRVLSAENVPVEGLYAVGEIAGGVHGAAALRGNKVLDSVVFGREAGQNAVGLFGS